MFTKINKGGSRQLAENFNESEFYKINADQPDTWDLPTVLLEALQLIRDYYGIPIKINSTYRGPNYNNQVGGATNSMHLCGQAVDFKFQTSNRERIEMLAHEVLNDNGLGRQLKQMGINGWGFYDGFVHIDNRSSFRVFKNETSATGNVGSPYSGHSGCGDNIATIGDTEETEEKQPNLLTNYADKYGIKVELIYAIGGALLITLLIMIFRKRYYY